MDRRKFLSFSVGALAASFLPWQKLLATEPKEKVGVIDDSHVPTGYITHMAGDFHPGWIPCDGREISEKDYPKLFAVLTSSSDGGTRFSDLSSIKKGKIKLPDFRPNFGSNVVNLPSVKGSPPASMCVKVIIKT